jgi:sugar lactone lactonase YvrE
MTSAVQATERCAHHGEGPFWDARVGKLFFVDMLAGAVVEWDTAGPVKRHPLGRPVVAVVRARSSGGYVLAVEHGFAFADAGMDMERALPEVFAGPTSRMNEGGCDPQGRFYCGSMAYDYRTGAGSLYRLNADRSVETVLTGVTISNGLQWSRDGSRVFYNDTATGRVDVFDFDGVTGAFTNRRPFAIIDGTDGAPDGMAIDEEDGIWVALWGGSAVRRYDSRGDLSEIVELPVPKVTACAFGGRDGRTLYITTSREGMAEGDFPQAGSIFSVEAGVRGAVQHAFAG